jgi:hypothetical protein
VGTSRVEPSRLRRGELIAAASAVLLIVLMASLTWYGIKTPLGWTAATLGVPTSFTGWNALTHLRWLVIVTTLAALALAYFQATRRAPAIPACLSVIVVLLGLITLLILAYRVLIDQPGASDVGPRIGAYLGLLSALGILYGGFASLRQEGIRPADGPAEIETVSLVVAELGTGARP